MTGVSPTQFRLKLSRVQTHPATHPKPSSSLPHVRTPTIPHSSYKIHDHHSHKHRPTKEPAISSFPTGRILRFDPQSHDAHLMLLGPLFWVKRSLARSTCASSVIQGSDGSFLSVPSREARSDPLSRIEEFSTVTVRSVVAAYSSTNEGLSEPPCSMPLEVQT